MGRGTAATDDPLSSGDYSGGVPRVVAFREGGATRWNSNVDGIKMSRWPARLSHGNVADTTVAGIYHEGLLPGNADRRKSSRSCLCPPEARRAADGWGERAKAGEAAGLNSCSWSPALPSKALGDGG